MKKQILIFVLVFLPLSLSAQEQEYYAYDDTAAYSQPVTYVAQQEPTQAQQVQQPQQVQQQQQSQEPQETQKQRKGLDVFTGFSGGMMLHGGYLFSDDPRKVFSNSGLGDESYVKGLPHRGFTFGLGGALRAHLIDHIHLGAEGFVSTMPLMGTGSNIRTAWGGALCDFYTTWGKVRPMIGITVGGGAMKRLYVPDQAAETQYMTADSTFYNASYTKTPFFLLDPYIGLEIGLKGPAAILIRIDYMLPFGKTSSKLTDSVKWSNFMTPSGPRLYIGVMFGKFNKTKT